MGKGYSVNMPLSPYTGNEVYCWGFDEVVPPLVAAFQPDVLVAQLGVDAYHRDPLAHLQLTTNGYGYLVRELLQLAPRVLALGGGGYDFVAVSRVWALEYGQMLGVDWPDDVPTAFAQEYDVRTLRDKGPERNEPRVDEQTLSFARQSVEGIKRLVFPIHGLS